MAENLNYDAEGSKCYNNSESNCETYGRLYDWATAMDVCPPDWHLPSDAEWDTLTTAVGGTGVGGYGYWWSSTEYNTASAYNRGMYYYRSNVGRDSLNMSYLYSVRCLKNGN